MLLAAVEQGLGLLTWESETFTYADGWDATRASYRSLQTGRSLRLALGGESLLIRPDAARRQLDAVQPALQATGAETEALSSAKSSQIAPVVGPAPRPTVASPKRLRRFYGSASVSDPNRLASRSKEIADAVVQHLTSLMGANVRITIEISANIPEGAPEHIVRTVTEDSRTLKFDQAGFEEE